jgi:hypothetical protein
MTKQPMNKFWKFVLWTGGILIGGFVLLLIAAAIIVPIVLPPAKLKAIASEKLTETLKHKVTIGDVHFNVLTGFEIKNLVIANRAGWSPKPLVAAKDISISYHLFPLLWGQVSLGEIKLTKPDILVEHRGMNSFNFSDMMGTNTAQAAPASAPAAKPKGKGKSKAKPKKKKKHAALQVPAEEPVASSFFADQAWADTAAPVAPSKTTLLVSVDSLNIIHANLVYLDEAVSPVRKSTATDLNFRVKNVSMVGGKTTFSLDTPLSSSGVNCKLDISGSLHFFLSSMSIKGLDLTGDISGNGFKFSGDALNLSTNFAPTMDGEASLDILKFMGLIPHSLSSMPEGLALDGPANVDFHLAGTVNSGLELSGTADGSGLVIKYKDFFVKTNKTTCKVDFKTINKLNQGVYDVQSFKVVYQDWEVNGAFHYQNGSFSGEAHSKSLPFKGLPGIVPKLKNTTVDGGGSLDATFSKAASSTKSFKVFGKVVLKGVGINLPQEPYIHDLNGPILLEGSVVRVPGLAFEGFDGTGVMGVTYVINTQAVNFGFRLKDVSAQKAIDYSIDAYVTKNLSDYKDKFFGDLNFSYSGAFRGFSGDQMISTSVGSGNYTLDKAKVKGFPAIKSINKYFKDQSDEINFEQIRGNMAMKNKIFTYNADTTGKVGVFRETGAINVADMVYSPDMKIQCDIKKEFLNSDAVQSGIPAEVKSIVTSGQQLIDYAADDNGNVPIDIKFTGPVKDNNYSYDWTRLRSNAEKKAGAAVKNAAQDLLKNNGQDLGDKLKGLFH